MPNKLGINMNVRDVARISALFDELKAVGGDSEKILETTAKNTVNKMKRQAPRDTGRLIDNIEYDHSQEGEIYFESEAIDPDTGNNYAPLVEYGLGQRAQPYFWRNIRDFRKNLSIAFGRMMNIKISKQKYD